MTDPVDDAGNFDLARLVRGRQPDLVDGEGWRAIDAAETARGVASGRPRVKITAVAEMLEAARANPASRRKWPRHAAGGGTFASARGKR